MSPAKIIGIICLCLLGVAQIFVTAFLVSAWVRPTALAEIDFGMFNNSVYTNSYFGLTVSVPPEWSIPDQYEQQRLQKVGENLISGNNQKLTRQLKAGELTTVNLFATFKYPVGTAVPFNPSVIAIAERVGQYPGVKRGRDYFYFVKKLLASGDLSVAFPGDFGLRNLGGVDFDEMDVDITIRGKIIKERYFATIKKGYALGFVATYATDEQASADMKILDTVQFH